MLIFSISANVFSLGDVANLGDTKTGAALFHQAPLVVKNLLSVMGNKEISNEAQYNGYTACPLTTGYGRLLLAEFDKDNKLAPSIPLLNPAKPHYLYWLLIRYIMPYMYWHRILTGKM